MTETDPHPPPRGTFLSRAALWHRLRGIGNSTPAKLTIVIPLVGYLILFNDKLQEWLRLSPSIVGIEAQVSGIEPRLLVIYFGLCLIASASFVFSCACPLEVKKYVSPEAYIAGEEEYLSVPAKGLIEHKLKNGDRIAKEHREGLRQWDENRPSASDIAEVRRRGKIFFRAEMHLYYEMLDRSCAVGR